jgi:hypothetical protein
MKPVSMLDEHAPAMAPKPLLQSHAHHVACAGGVDDGDPGEAEGPSGSQFVCRRWSEATDRLAVHEPG